MSRAALYSALVSDPILNGYGLNQDTVFHNYSLEEKPTQNTPFIILRWEEEPRHRFANVRHHAPRNLTLWVHWPLKVTNDFEKINAVLDRVDDVVRELRDVPGTDGYTLTFVEIHGRSADLVDDGFETITRNASYQIHSVPSGVGVTP